MQSSSCWPKTPDSQVPEEVPEELKKSTFCGSLSEAELVVPDALQFCSYCEFLEATGRFLQEAADGTESPSADDIEKAELSILRQCQKHDFLEEFTLLKGGKDIPAHSQHIKLAPEYDRELDLIRVGGRLRRCDTLSDDVLHPIVLSPNNPVVKLLIKHCDAQLHHPGAGRVYAELRRKFWILQGREAIKKYQRSCLDCKKWRGKPIIPRMSDLPDRWGIVYKCLTTRAVHLDLLDHMDGDSFLLSLRRFIARRGKPYELKSSQVKFSFIVIPLHVWTYSGTRCRASQDHGAT